MLHSRTAQNSFPFYATGLIGAALIAASFLLFFVFFQKAHGQQAAPAVSANTNLCSGYASSIVSHADPAHQTITSVYEFWYSNRTHSCLYSYYQYHGPNGESLGVRDVETGKDVWTQALDSVVSVPSATDTLDQEQSSLQ